MKPRIDFSATTETTNSPVIDFSKPVSEVADLILDTATKYGFLYIDTKSTGFTRNNVDRMFELSRKFFDSPADQKRKCEAQISKPGWVPFRSRSLDPEHQKNGEFRETFILTEFDANGNPQQMIPEAFKGCLDEIFQFQNTCRELCMKILTAFATSLETENLEFFTLRHQRPTSTQLGLHKYQAVPDDMDFNPETDIRIGAHSDYGSITLIFQREGQPGLEVKTPEGLWVPVPVFPAGFHGDLPPILMIFGDVLHYWTNGLLRSTVHRVVFPKGGRRGGEDRYSITYFLYPNDDAKLFPLPSKMVRSMKPIEDGEQVGYGGGASKVRPESAGEHILNRRSAQRFDKSITR